jgi:hypothetical protein
MQYLMLLYQLHGSQLRAVLGLVNYQNWFGKRLISQIVKPLVQLIKVDEKFILGDAQKQFFQELKTTKA